MPEIWLNHGAVEVVLDIKAENLEQKLAIEGKTLSDSDIKSKLESLDLSKPTELVVLNASESVKKVLSAIFVKCEEKSITKPTIFADRKIINTVKRYFQSKVLYLNFLTWMNLILTWFLWLKWNLMECLVLKPFLQDY